MPVSLGCQEGARSVLRSQWAKPVGCWSQALQGPEKTPIKQCHVLRLIKGCIAVLTLANGRGWDDSD